MSGSSPPVRGTFYTSLAKHKPERFIPARAGNIWIMDSRSPESSVHPRPCGEHLLSCGQIP